MRRIRAHTFVCLTESAAAAWGKQKSPGWPASDFRVLSPRDIYGTFCPGPICPGKAGPRRKYRPATGVSVGTNLSHSACMRRKGFSPQLIRRRRKMPQVFFAWRRGLKSVFAPFWGFGQKGVAARTHAEDATSGRAAKPCPKFVKVCLPMSRQHLFCRMPGSHILL